MYLATRRQSNSTRAFGLIGSAVVIAAVGGVLVSMRETITTVAPPPSVMVPLAQDDPTIDEPTPIDLNPVDPRIPLVPVLLPPLERFTWDKTDMPDAPPVTYGTPTPGTGVGPSTTPQPPAIPATRPVLMAGEKPEYPLASTRARESGVTTLSLCVSRQGRVTSASISASSGFARLDQAALAWIRHERFKAGTENGQPADVCNHLVSYEWKLPPR